MDICLSQLPTIIEEGTAFRVSGLQSSSQVRGPGRWGPEALGARGRRPRSTQCTSADVPAGVAVRL